MSTDEARTEEESGFSLGRRRRGWSLPVDPTDEALARDWTLSEADLGQVLRCRGDTQRRWFALQLCTFRKHGRFVSQEMAKGAVRVVNHLSGQLELTPVVLVEPPAREATDWEHEQRIRDYLGHGLFEARDQERLEEWLTEQAGHGPGSLELYEKAEAVLRSWKVQLPAPSTLDRIVASTVARAQQQLVEQLASGLASSVRQSIDDLLNVPDGEPHAGLYRFKEYPRKETPRTINDYIDRYRSLESMGIAGLDLGGLNPFQAIEWAELVKRYKAKDLRRFAPSKRHVMVACFLAEAQKTILDYIVALNDKYVVSLGRRANQSFEKGILQLRARSQKGFELVLAAAEALLDTERDPQAIRGEFLSGQAPLSLRTAVEACRELQRFEKRGLGEELRARYGHLRRYLPAFLELPFAGAPGSEALLEAVNLARALNSGRLSDLPQDAPLEFVAPRRQPFLLKETGCLDRALWEIELTRAVKEALRSGDLFLPGSRRHVAFSNLLFDDRRWKQEREQAYVQLSWPLEAQQAIDGLRENFAQVARSARDGLVQNTFARIEDGRLHLTRMDAREIPETTRELKRVLATSLPRVRIEDLLQEVDAACGFAKAFDPLPGYETRDDDFRAPILAALVAHGTNLGLSAMGHSAQGVSIHQLQTASRWFVRDETLQAANAALVNFHHGLELSFAWGDATTSSSDGQRFGSRPKSLVTAYYPRYFGYYERALTVLTHTSDQHSVFATRVISCGAREAQYVLDGLLENNTVLRPREHFTDTHGYTEHIFGLCYLLGISFAPRIADLASQQLYKLDRQTDHGPLEPLFSEVVDLSLIAEHWDELIRIAASLVGRTTPAHVVVQRLASGSKTSRLARALTALGQVVKTIYILRYIQDEELRRRVQRQLNRGESRHELARWLFFANQGEFCTADYEEIMNKASCLSLLSNAVLVWNTLQMAQIVRQLRASGQSVADDDLARISPLAHAHVIPSGTYHFDRPSLPAGPTGE